MVTFGSEMNLSQARATKVNCSASTDKPISQESEPYGNNNYYPIRQWLFYTENVRTRTYFAILSVQ